MTRFLLSTLLLFAFFISAAQTTKLDSLKRLLKEVKSDTTRSNIISKLQEIATGNERLAFNQQLLQLVEDKLKSVKKTQSEYRFYQKHLASALNLAGDLAKLQGDHTTALEHYRSSMKIVEEIGDKKGVGTNLFNIGRVYDFQGDNSEALKFYLKSLKIFEEIKYKEGVAFTLNNIGFIFNNQGEMQKAMEHFLRSLKISEELGDKKGMSESFGNIAVIYEKQNDIPKALEYHNKSLKISEEIGNQLGVGNSLNNIGAIYGSHDNSSKALECYNKSLKIRESLGDEQGVATSLHNIGFILYDLNDNSGAMEKYQKSMNIFQRLGDKEGASACIHQIAWIYYDQKNYKQAEEYFKKSMTLSKELGFPHHISSTAKSLYHTYKAMGNYKLALENYQLFIRMRDSINNIETQKSAIEQQTQYEYEKKKALADKEHELQIKQQKDEAAADKARQNTIIVAVSVVLLLVAVFSGFLYSRFKVTRKQKRTIEEKEKVTQYQKHLIEEKHKEITDSINYAERIQKSFLATKLHLDTNLPEYFVMFKPKDVVSGDFYWSSTLDNGNFALATADSTGHGVPGAIMSLLNITSLEKSIEQSSEPAEILNLTRRNIIERLKKDGSPDGGKDGMDCSLCVYDFENRKLHVAAANNPVWIVRLVQGSSGHGAAAEATAEKTLIEVKPDKMPVGKHDKDTEFFTQTEITLQPGDMIYTLTDGFPDQFGGEKGKKFMSKNLKELLTRISHLSADEQKNKLEETFRNWVGSAEQVDDVTVIGIRT